MAGHKKDQEYGSPRDCGHCGIHAAMEIVCKFDDTEMFATDDFSHQWKEGYRFELLKCPKCKNIELQRYLYSDLEDFGCSDYKTLYPAPPTIPAGLPPKVKKEYLAALKEKRRSPNAYGVLLGRVLETLCKDKKAKGNMLGNQINNLAQRNIIPQQLASLAFRANDFRVVGAHAEVGHLTEKEIPILENLTRAALEYVYSVPYYLAESDKALKKYKNLNRRRKKK